MVSSLSLLRRSLRFLTDHSPAILTSLGVAGVVGTTVLAVKATPDALRDIWDAESEISVDDVRTSFEKIRDRTRVAWIHYVPAALIGSATIVSIIGAQSINKRRQAAIMSLYTITDRAYNEYQSRVRDTIGSRKEENIRDSIAGDKINANLVSSSQILVTGTGDNLCYDTLTGRYFKSDIETIRRAQNDVNAEAINNQYASQNDFYRHIGLPPVVFGEEHGWRADAQMDISFSSHLSEDGKPCLALDYAVKPIRGYWKMNE